MFFARSASLRDSVDARRARRPSAASARPGAACNPSSVPSSSGLLRPADLGQGPVGELVGVDDDRRALGRSARFAFSAAGFIATSTSGASPGVRMSWSAKCTWKTTPREGAGRRPDLGREVRQRREIVAELRGLLREPVTGELHAVAGVAGEPDDDTIQLLDVLGHAGRGLPASTCRSCAAARLRCRSATGSFYVSPRERERRGGLCLGVRAVVARTGRREARQPISPNSAFGTWCGYLPSNWPGPAPQRVAGVRRHMFDHGRRFVQAEGPWRT